MAIYPLKKWILFFALSLILATLPRTSQANPIGFDGNIHSIPGSARPTNPNAQPGFPPFMFNPNRDLYDWKIKDYPDYQECTYDENWGQWVGTCNLSLDSPGFSVTTPNRIR